MATHHPDNTQLEQVLKWVHGKLGTDDFQRRINFLSVVTLLPAVLFLVGLSVLPFLYIIWSSLHEVSLIGLNFQYVGAQNYTDMFAGQELYDALWIGTVFAVGSTLLQLVLGLALAVLLNQKFFGSLAANTLAILPYLIPTIVVALIWKFILSPVHGVVNMYLLHFGLIDQAITFFGSADLAMPTLILANSWKFTSFALVIFLARLQSIDENLYEQAKINGASGLQMFRDITLPHLRGAIMLVLMLKTIWMFHKFDIVFLLTKGGPLGETTTLPIVIYQVAFGQFRLGMASAYAVVLFAILTAVAIVYFWRFKPSEEVASR